MKSGTKRGYAFFFQKGALAAVHCKPSSDCQVLVSEPLPSCQTKVLFQFFQFNFSEETVPCNCCYSCIKRDADLGCDQCREFIDAYLSPKKCIKFTKSSMREMKDGFYALFRGMGMESVMVESKLEMSVESFFKDFVRAVDEITCAADIVDMWHVEEYIASSLYDLFREVMEDSEFEEVESSDMDSDSVSASVAGSDSTDSSINSDSESSYDGE